MGSVSNEGQGASWSCIGFGVLQLRLWVGLGKCYFLGLLSGLCLG